MDRVEGDLLIDELDRDNLRSALGTARRPVSDRVMGSVSRAALPVEEQAGRRRLYLGLVAIERELHADLRLAEPSLYREPVVSHSSRGTGP